ncbi:MAG: hemerythrin, partial [Treponema sp.]|nr:hemerythrin [Treponema sp.]
ISFPDSQVHKIQHEEFIREVLDEVKKFESGYRFAPGNFARFLQNWILTHIAIHDKKYGVFCDNLRADGVKIPLD